MMSLAAKKKLWLRASDTYYNGRSHAVMTDAEFDKLDAEIRAADPEWEHLVKTGAPVVNKKTETKLQYYMPSLAKCYPEKIGKWLAKQDGLLLVMNKLDGSSLQLTYEKGVPVKLVTRGDGTLGGDISFLIPALKIPKKISSQRCTVFRCEALMTKKVFAVKYADKFENIRNTVNGWLNRKTPHSGLADTDIVVLGVYNMEMDAGLTFAIEQGFKVVDHTLVKKTADMSQLLATRRARSVYEMDGLVMCRYDQLMTYANADRPKWMMAYKENDMAGATEAVVEDIIYQDSRNSILIPKIKIKPVRIGGTTVTYATSHNAQWMLDRGIGPGAIIKIVRSGDVIPKIVGVVKKAKPKLPDVAYEMKGVHFKALVRSKEADVNLIQKFFGTMSIEFIAKKTIATLYDEGITDALSYLKIWSHSMLAFQLKEFGIGNIMSQKIEGEFTRVFSHGVLLRDLMVASNCFDVGIGERKLKMIEKHYSKSPNALADLVNCKTSDYAFLFLEGVPGFATKTQHLVVDGLIPFRLWLKEALKYIKVSKPVREAVPKSKAGPLSGQLVSFTGYRDAEHERHVTEKGGEVVPFGSKTTILLYKEGGKMSSKLDKAREKGIKVVTFKELK